MRICSVEGCEAKHYGRGYCQLHWHRWYRYGDPREERPLGRVPEVPPLLTDLGITYRQFDYWCRNKYVKGLEGNGSGFFRRAQAISPTQRERLIALAVASKIHALSLPELADAIQDGSVKCIEGFRGD